MKIKACYLLLASALVVALATFGWLRKVHQTKEHEAYLCISNLRTIDATKEFYAHEHGLKPGDLISTQVMIELHAWPKTCPAGGTYTINPVGKEPTCSVAGHAIPY